MLEEHQICADQGEGLDLLDLEAVRHVAHLGQSGSVLGMGRPGDDAHAGQRQHQGQCKGQQFLHDEPPF